MAGSASFLWVAAGLIGLVSVAPSIEQAASEAPAEPALAGAAIPRAPDGQFYIEAKVGEFPVRFLVDGGTESVVLAGPDAERLGLGSSDTAELANLSIGSRAIANVPAWIARGVPVSLIGRSYLSRVVGAEFTRDRLVLR